MKKTVLLFLALFLASALGAQTGKKIVIFHTNDLHSRIIGYSPESGYTPLTVNDDKTIGGFARIGAIILDEKEKNPAITLAVDAGDFFMGTLFTPLEPKTGFQLRLMKSMGYDVVGLGNHEFDYGPKKLAQIIKTSAENGEIPSMLASNAIFSAKDPGDNDLEQLSSEQILGRQVILTRDNIRIGFFSILGKNAGYLAPKAEPITFAKQIPFAKKMVKELKDKKCDIIICISHSGVSKDKNGEWRGEDYELAKNVKGIDLIVGGHSHTKLEQPLMVNGIPIIQTGEFGQFVGRISLTYKEGTLHVDDYRLIPVDDKIPGDREINELIDQQKKRISMSILDPLGIDYDKPVAETDFVIEGNDGGDFINSNLGPIVADAIHSYINAHSKAGTDVSMIAAGVLFDKICVGVQTAPDIFRVVSLGSGYDEVPGYPLSRLYVTGKELKSILEILLVAYKSSPDNYCYYSGIRVAYDPDKGLLKKIKKIEIIHRDGKAVNVDFSKKNKSLYSITANSYMLEFIGIIKKTSFGLINVVPKDAEGNRVTEMKNAIIDVNDNLEGVQEGKEWLALLEFLSRMKDTNGNGIPDIDKKYSVPVRSFFTLK
ncbi:MAG: 5'-nucleotidase C-terminal domain-containing protein [Bacteroidia bacterium]|nr:5'-nucleotidase C-terminal domain-containing protein [Bacteroidia bacterium]